MIKVAHGFLDGGGGALREQRRLEALGQPPLALGLPIAAERRGADDDGLAGQGPSPRPTAVEQREEQSDR